MKKYDSILEKAYGSEPVWGVESYATEDERDSALQRAFSWYWGKGTNRERKRWVLEYCKHSKMTADEIKQISQNGIKAYSAFAYLCRMATRGAPLDQKSLDKIKAEINSLSASGSAILEKRKTANLPSIQERTETKYLEYLGDIDAYVDQVITARSSKDDVKFDALGWVNLRKVKPMHCSKIASYIETTYLAEMLEAFSGKDKQLVEGYSYLTKPKFKKVIQHLSETVNAFNNIAVEKKTARKPRQKKQKTASQQVKKVKYLPESKEYAIKSISPDKIIGSTLLVVFNEKYRILSVYHASDPRGLGIKGTTIQNFDIEKSTSRKLRKPKDILKRLTGVRSISTVMQELKTKPIATTGRLNENCVIVGAF